MKRARSLTLALLCLALFWAAAPALSEPAPVTFLETPEGKLPSEWVSFDAALREGMPPMRFTARWVDDRAVEPEEEGYSGWTESCYQMTVAQDEKTVQAFEFTTMDVPLTVNGEDFYRYDVNGPIFSLEDINGDGYADLRILTMIFPSNLFYDVFLYQPGENQFAPLRTADGGGLSLTSYNSYPAEKMLTTYFDDEYLYGNCTLYRWEGNALRPLRASYWDESEEDCMLRIVDLTVSEPGPEEGDGAWLAYEEKSTIATISVSMDADIYEIWVDALFDGLTKPEGAKIHGGQ